ncbi:MAG: carbohydrate-binding protein [Candidatus Hydrogenedentota bacterium]
MWRVIMVVLLCAGLMNMAEAREFHVSPSGDDGNDASASSPLKTISAAAELAQPGDVVTVHKGVYRERITPPRGGESDAKRIVYRAAPGEAVTVKGSEVVKGWKKVEHDTWKVTLPNTFFGEYNPFGDPIAGDWFSGKGREHHTGAVYLDGHWLIEAAKKEEVLAPAGITPSWLRDAGKQYLLNVAWLQPEKGADRIPATSFAQKNGTQNAACSEGGECIGFIQDGHWVKYENINFGAKTEQLNIRAASASHGGIIEIRLDGPSGKFLGACSVANTGGWQSWRTFKINIQPVSGIKTLCLVFKSFAPQSADDDVGLWFAEVNDTNTTIWAQFQGANPNESLVEVNVRRAVFYPDKPFVNFISVIGFTMEHAATQWAPPTAEQIGLVGTHWSKGWIIQDNVIRYSVCTGVTLGKYGDEYDNTSANTAEGYVKTIERALENGWNKETIGHHIVRNNTIAHCEQAGLVGSMGAVFSTITGNSIHDIHVRQLFTGAEMAGIKIHAAIDTEISRNHIYRTCRGIWLDWMAQGTRVTQNLLHHNVSSEDLFVEVNHGPFMVDNNIFLSPRSLSDMSQGGAYVHNLFAGGIMQRPELNRETPYQVAHGTAVAGLSKIAGGDSRFFNNIFAGHTGLATYDKASRPMFMAGNVFLNGAEPAEAEKAALALPEFDPAINLIQKSAAYHLEITLDLAWGRKSRELVTTERLGKAVIPDLPYVQPDGTPYRIDRDYFGSERDAGNPFPGPFASVDDGRQTFQVWPVERDSGIGAEVVASASE